ncbi:MAG TPA: permease prefix domain 1-containing protein [Calditrichia bacterium]|nr:hypothetical protein [Calditrichota bacterium]HQU72263.1 permease prefix domain 1-containing protein [Calditrichia bacterium]HQV30327.1 permease prefix domain 1-containing protein [Calditrichia bacterium]
MFNLNRQILKWRIGLMVRGAFEKSDLDELESHLRDDIDALKRIGCSEEEAFHKAAQRLGDARFLRQEYLKNNGSILWLKRAAWVSVFFFTFFMMFVQCSV